MPIHLRHLSVKPVRQEVQQRGGVNTGALLLLTDHRGWPLTWGFIAPRAINVPFASGVEGLGQAVVGVVDPALLCQVCQRGQG